MPAARRVLDAGNACNKEKCSAYKPNQERKTSCAQSAAITGLFGVGCKHKTYYAKNNGNYRRASENHRTTAIMPSTMLATAAPLPGSLPLLFARSFSSILTYPPHLFANIS